MWGQSSHKQILCTSTIHVRSQIPDSLPPYLPSTFLPAADRQGRPDNPLQNRAVLFMGAAAQPDQLEMDSALGLYSPSLYSRIYDMQCYIQTCYKTEDYPGLSSNLFSTQPWVECDLEKIIVGVSRNL